MIYDRAHNIPMIVVSLAGVIFGNSCGIIIKDVIGRNIKIPTRIAAMIARVGLVVLIIKKALRVMIAPLIIITGFLLPYFFDKPMARIVPIIPPMPESALKVAEEIAAFSVCGNNCRSDKYRIKTPEYENGSNKVILSLRAWEKDTFCSSPLWLSLISKSSPNINQSTNRTALIERKKVIDFCQVPNFSITGATISRAKTAPKL